MNGAPIAHTLPKTAVILGATGGIGEAVTLNLLGQGWNVIGTYHAQASAEALKKAAESLKMQERGQGKGISFTNSIGTLTLYHYDERDRQSENALVSALCVAGEIGLFTSTVGALGMQRFERTDEATFKDLYEVTVFSQVRLLQKLSPQLCEGSSVVFILTEMTVKDPPPLFSGYVSAKYALLGLMKSLAREWAPRKIRVNALSPGMMETRFSTPIPKLVKNEYAKRTKAGSLTIPQDVAQGMLNLLAHSEITGTNKVIPE